MHKHSLGVGLKVVSVSQILILCILVFSACTTKRPAIDVEERHKIQSFLNRFLFVEGAVFSLFGEKPLSAMLIFTGNEHILAGLSEEELETTVFIDDSIREDWQAWKHFAHRVPSKNFVFAERPCLRDPYHVLYFLMNVERVKEILHRHHLAFQTKTGARFDSDKVVHEFGNPRSSFWSQVLADHYLTGLLFGYGEENITHFLDRITDQEGDRQFSDEFDASATPTKFPIPMFAISSEDKTAARYREQRKRIQSEYCGKDIVDVTIKRLAN
jgi:hypothetical protein